MLECVKTFYYWKRGYTMSSRDQGGVDLFQNTAIYWWRLAESTMLRSAAANTKTGCMWTPLQRVVLARMVVKQTHISCSLSISREENDSCVPRDKFTKGNSHSMTGTISYSGKNFMQRVKCCCILHRRGLWTTKKLVFILVDQLFNYLRNFQ